MGTAVTPVVDIACCNTKLKFRAKSDRSLKKKCDVYDGLHLRSSDLGVSSSEHEWPSKKAEIPSSEHQ
ncbi:MAG: hypothetical protein V7K53_00485 [Nostoc sp.]|uniref:hypothetical protein n=1 Tax=Nostoc sp. TaxID=1180 RepID=UPI002FF6E18F